MEDQEQSVSLVRIPGLRAMPASEGGWFASGASRPGLEIESLDICAGHCYAVIGKSGAGKSVLNSLLVGYPAFACAADASSGEGCWWGRVPLSAKTLGSRFRMRRWRRISKRFGSILYLPQQLPDGIDYSMSADVYLRQVYAALCDECDIGVVNRIDYADLGELATKLGQPVNRLSGGERRRLELWIRLKVLSCRTAIQSKPALLILDEPTTGLDLTEERRYLKMLHERLLGTQGVAAVVTTHALHLLDESADVAEESGNVASRPFFDHVIVVRKKVLSASSCICRVSTAFEIGALKRRIDGHWEDFLGDSSDV